MNILKEFFGVGGYQRTPEGYFSWQHLLFVTSLMVVMTVLAIWLGRTRRFAEEREKLKVLMIAAILIDAFEIFKIVSMCLRANDPMGWITELPLFLCSIQLITIPLAAFSKGRIQEAALDFVLIFGILGAVLVIKGFVKPTRKVEFCKELNTELVFTAVVSAIWVLAMDYLGFLLTSTVAMFLMLYRFQPKELRNAKCLMQFCLIIFGELAFMWLVFVKFLAVSLPEGQFFRMIGLA